MLLDEITAFLDLPRRVDVMSTLRTLAHESGRALLLSAHDLDVALRTADRI
jgi:iron complex transport system ATP-binding protein